MNLRNAAPAAILLMIGVWSDALAQTGRATSSGHLYVADGLATAVYRFALTDGIPAPTPLSELTGLRGPRFVDVGPDGYLYVEDGAGVKVFPADAAGNARPLRFLAVGLLANMRVDRAGYLYLSSGPPLTVAIYAPQAQGVDQPIALVPIPQSDSNAEINGLAIGADGDLYVSTFDAGTTPTIYVYATPISHPTLVRQLCAANYVDYLMPTVVAGRLFVARGDSTVSGFKATANGCPEPPHRSFRSKVHPIYIPKGVAARAGFMYASSFNGPRANPGAVFVFNTAADGDQPIDILRGHQAQFKYVDDIAVGP